jgi:hypothetical protein
MRRCLLLLLVVTTLLIGRVQAQVLPPLPAGGGAAVSGTFPPSTCVNMVAVGMADTGLLVCAPVTPALAPGLVPSGVDLSATGQVTSTHLSAPLPVTQGGVGISTGTSGGIPYFNSDTTLASTAMLPLNAPIFGGGPGQAPVPGSLSGTTRQLASVTGTLTPNKQLTFDANGNVIASTADIAGGLAIPVPVVQGGTGLTSGTSGGLVYFTTATSMASSAVFPLNAPLLGGGPGQAPVSGTLSGTTRALGSVAGPLTPDKQLVFDATGNIIASPMDVGGAAVVSVFGRVGAVVAVPNDYTAAQVTNAADVTAPNVFTHSLGQSMVRLLLPGQVSGTMALRAAPITGISLITLPGGSTDFSSTGGPSQVVRQSATGAAFTVSQLALSDLSGASTVCTSTTVCPGYQAALGFSAENVANKAISPALGGSNTLYPTQLAVKTYVDTAVQGLQPTLGFTPENVANKSSAAILGPSNTLYPTQGAVKAYVDAGLAGTQAAITWGPGLQESGGVASTLSSAPGFLVASVPDLASGVNNQGRMQVLADGRLQYTDGAAVSVLHTGFLTQSILRWNVTPGACTGDANAGKLTINSANEIVCASDLGGGTGGGGGAVTSVFGRTGAVVATAGDYTAAMVSNAADLTLANIFPHPAGQSMPKLLLTGSVSGSIALAPAGMSGTATFVFPTGATNLSVSGGPNQVVRQSTVGGGLTVSQLDFTNLSGTSNVCTTSSFCPGYQAALTAGAGLTLTGATIAVASTAPGFLTNGGTTDLGGGSGQGGKMQVMSDGRLQYTDYAATPTLHSGFFVTPVGPAGTLQASTGAGGLSGFVGFTCPVAGTFATAIQGTGALTCAAVSSGGLSSAQALLAASSAEVPAGVNLAALPTGLLLSTVSAGVATISTRTAPVGQLLGTTDVQEVTQTRVTPRQCSQPTTATPLVVDLNSCDVIVLSELQQATLIDNPTGSVRPSQPLRFRAHSTLPRAITWGSFWHANPDQALPSATTGGGTEDVWLFEYSSRLGQAVLTYTSQQVPHVVLPADTTLVGTAHALMTGQGPFTAGHCVQLDTNLNLVDTGAPCGSGTGGGGGGTPAGVSGDIQYNRQGVFAADSGEVMLDPTTHTLVAANLQGPFMGSYFEVRDRLGHKGYLMTPSNLGASMSWSLPTVPGEICVKGGAGCGGTGSALTIQEIDGVPSGQPGVLKVSNGALTDNGDGSFTLVTGVGGGGDFSTNTTVSVDSEVVVFSGTGGKTGKRSTGTGLATLAAGVLGVSAPSADDQILVSDSASIWTWRTLPNCVDATGQHLNYTAATNTWSCGTSSSGGAPAGATYWLSSANAALTAATNLGALTTGLLKQTVTAGVSTPATAVAGTDYVVPGGNVATATALATNGSNCTAGQAAQGVDAQGNAEGCFLPPVGGDFSSNTALSVDSEVVLFSGTAGKTGKRATGSGLAKLTSGVLGLGVAGTDYVLPSGTVASATALASNGSNCAAGQAAQGVDAQGNAEGCFTPPVGGNVSNSGTPVAGQTAEWLSATTLGGVATTGTGSYVKSSATTPTDDTVLIGSGTTWAAAAVPNCLDSAGQHLNYNASTNTLNCGTSGSPTSALTIQEIDGVPSGKPGILKVSNGALTDNGDGSFTLVTGVAGGGDFSTNTAVSVDSEIVLFSGTGGKTGMRSTGTGLAKLTSGVLSTATAGTDYVVPSGNVATATALAANGSNCVAGQAATGVDAQGNAEGCFTPPTGDFSTNTAISVDSEIVLFSGTAGKTGKRSTGTGLAKLTSGVLGLGVAGTDFVVPSGNVATATALAADGSNCVAGQAAQGVDPQGNAQGCFTPPIGGDFSSNTALSVDSEVVLFSGTAGKTGKRATGTGLAKLTSGVLGVGVAGTDYVLPSGNVATATALAADGTNCAAGQAAQGVDPQGNAQGCFTPPVSGNVSNSGTPVAAQAAEWVTATTIQGVAVIGSGSYVKATSPTLTTPTIAALANLTTNGLVTTSGGTGTLGTVAAPAGAVVGTTDTQTLTNKRLPPRVTTLTSAGANPSFQCDFGASDQCELSATTLTAGTLTVSPPLGAMQNGEMRMMLFLCTAAQTFAWDVIFIASPNIPLPLSCPAGVSNFFATGFRWSSTLAKFQILASN